ncbi:MULTISPECIES: sodium:proton antiporter [unclassified Micromonospora]|uniref:sodium:proton antiporter n=1 Tax=unclassified Micromonospora TaxID=2617518 RepID=UPI0022B68D2C|nr:MULTISPECIES: sodium:proton antiporter [unclassified Micromonospora]MCZ7418128.1 sodium:proton antiporter [Verrucosispora sp. WMMA2121]WBB91877.1 sodium:proton antiporter [Verrucosispora sp. WMMC514]
MSAAFVVGVLVAAGVFLLLRPGLLRVVLGFVLLGHAVNVVLLAAGGLGRRTPALQEVGPDTADPLPQAFVLTAIVITFGVTIHLLGLLRRGAGGPASGADPADDDGGDTESGGDGTGAAGGRGTTGRRR